MAALHCKPPNCCTEYQAARQSALAVHVTLHFYSVFFSVKKNKTKKHSATLPSGGELSDLQLSQSLQNGSERCVSYLRCSIRKQMLTKKKD